MNTVIDTSYFIEYIKSPFEDRFTWIADADLTVPTLFNYEVHNVALKALKYSLENVYDLNSILNSLKITYFDIRSNEAQIYELACDNNLSFYDASFLWLAIDGEIATYDKAVIASANRLNVKVIE